MWAVLVAAGEGRRFGAPKQFVELGGQTVLERSIAVCRAACDGVVVVVPEGHGLEDGDVLVAPGGDTRAASVRSGLRAVPADAEVIVVHDAARPLASPSLFAAVIEAVRGGADGVVPGLAVSDTVKRVDHAGVVVETVARDDLWTVQTPQAFAADVLRRAHVTEADATDDAALVEAIGGRVVVVPGEAMNRKITVPADLEWARKVVQS